MNGVKLIVNLAKNALPVNRAFCREPEPEKPEVNPPPDPPDPDWGNM